VAGAEEASPEYVVVDLSGGTNAVYWPVSVMKSAPEGGWTDEYKTSKLVLRRIPAGSFMMGSPAGELGHQTNEVLHEVTLPEAFYMGVFEVTQKQYETVMGSNPSSSSARGNTRPVEGVTYRNLRGMWANWPEVGSVDRGSFFEILSRKTGLDFDLPTEAQWEYACRADTTNALNSGKELTTISNCPNVAAVGWYRGNTDDATRHRAVGQLLPNAWGLYDMHGNVWELCRDWHGNLGPDAATDPVGAATGSERVMRGGCWSSSAFGCRSAMRSSIGPEKSSWGTGFRVMASVDETRYLVVDMSGGAAAAKWPVGMRAFPPEGGWTDEYKTTKLVMRRVPVRAFTMGSPTNELGRFSGEPEHMVSFSEDYYVGVFEVTQKQWELATGENPSMYPEDMRPVEQVNYDDIRGPAAGTNWPADTRVDASSFLGVVREKTGIYFDLPTEAQWENACRAGTRTALNSGKDLTTVSGPCPNLAEVARYASDKDDGKGGFGEHTTVGSYLPNAWGLYDMHGNVAEWCLDWYGDLPAETVTDPAGPDTGTGHVLRGGHWNRTTPRYCRSSSRDSMLPSGTSWGDTVGLRLACPAQSRFLVVDMAGGKDAESWPVTELAGMPESGWTDEYKTTKLLLRRISGGSPFKMGSPTNELGRSSSPYEEAQHSATLSKEYFIGVFEVTQRQWELATGKRPSCFSNPSCYATRPVEQVSYDAIRGTGAGTNWPATDTVDAGTFLGILRAKTGRAFDLPTEAQWEYACRAGTTNALNSGKDLTTTTNCPNMAEVGRYWYNSGRTADPDPACGTSQATAPVGSYRPNTWGLFDMHGNVDEWCLDWYGSYSTSSVTDPTGPSTGTARVLRGGCWVEWAGRCRSATRASREPSAESSFFGFRLCLP
jgi:formylglycine-generating enzyme required for sulfatase activity